MSRLRRVPVKQQVAIALRITNLLDGINRGGTHDIFVDGIAQQRRVFGDGQTPSMADAFKNPGAIVAKEAHSSLQARILAQRSREADFRGKMEAWRVVDSPRLRSKERR